MMEINKLSPARRGVLVFLVSRLLRNFYAQWLSLGFWLHPRAYYVSAMTELRTENPYKCTYAEPSYSNAQNL